MVTAPEAQALLLLAAGYDNRKPDQMVSRAWAEALADVDYQDARAFIVRHYQSTREWLMPSDIVADVRRVERERVANGPNLDELEMPVWLSSMEDGPDFVAAYSGWYKEQKRRIRRGEPVEVGPTPVLSERKLSELVS